jgi:8-oxo-dGTP diphosphatase
MKKTKYVVGFYFSPDTKDVLLILRNRPDWQKGFYNGLGGHVENNETPIDAMVREFKEETGISTHRSHWKNFFYLSSTHWMLWVYCARSFNIYGSQQTSDEGLPQTINAMSLPKNCLRNLYWLIPMARYYFDFPEEFRTIKGGG